MGVTKFLIILSIVVIVTLCDETENKQQNFATSIIDNRFKRETENDSVINKPKLLLNPIKKHKTLRISPTAKNLNHLKICPRIIIPKGHRVPIIPTFQKIKPPENVTEIKNVSNDNITEANDCKVTDDVENGNNPIQNAETDKNGIDEDAKKEESEIENVDQVTSEKMTEEDSKNETKTLDNQIENSTPKEINSSENDAVCADVPTKQNAKPKNPVLNNANKLNNLPATLLPKIKGYHKIPAKPIKLIKDISEDTTKSNKTDKLESKDPNYSMVVEPIKQINDVSNDKQTDPVIFDVNRKIDPLPIVTRTAKLLPNMNNPQTQLIVSNTNLLNKTKDSIDSEGVENKVQTQKESDVDLLRNKSLKIEPNEELLIQNNNYEEMFETSAPQNLSPKLITSQLHHGQNRNFFPSLHDKIKYNAPKIYGDITSNKFNKPYSYDIKEYPDKYVINTYDENGLEDPRINANRRNQGKNNQYFESNFGQINNYRQHPNRIWRSWRNNQIMIRPKSPITVNVDDLYAKEYVKRNLQFNNNGVRFMSVENHNNVSPYLYQTSSQFRNSNGY